MNFFRIHRALVIFVLLSGGCSDRSSAATIRFQPVADTTLVEIAPDSNMGATWFLNAGTAGSSGLRNRGLYQFDFSSIPAHSKIKFAAVTLEVTREPSGGGPSSSFALHRMLKSWGEGDKNSTEVGSPGLGFPASTNEATWNARFAFTTNTWTFPGASNDFAAAVSSSTVVYGVALFPFFDSTPQMIADVQSWLNDPPSNFGWLLKTESESTARTARSFGSREFAGIDTNSPPYLEVEFIPPPIISGEQIANGRFEFSFLAESNQSYVVEFKDAVMPINPWLTLTNLGASIAATNVLVSDTLSTNTRFYRVSLP